MAGEMKKILLILTAAILIAILFSIPILNRPSVFTIVYTTDLQGFITPHANPVIKAEPIPLLGGSAYFATYVKKERRAAEGRRGGFLLVDTGNFFAGQAEGYFLKGSSVIEIMNILDYDAMVLGPKDFAFGEENLRNLAKDAEFPFLGANIVRKNTGKTIDYIKPHVIKEKRGFKIGIIGITSPNIFSEHIKGIKILDPILTARKQVAMLNDIGTDLIVVLSNLGLAEDERLANEVEGIDVIIGGNDPLGHRELVPFYVDPKNKTVIAYTWEKGIDGYRLDTILNKQKKIVDHRAGLVELWAKKIKPDPDIQSIIRNSTETVEQKKKKIVGYAEKILTRSRDGESTLGNWVADILREKTKTDIILVGGLQADLKEGNITIGDVYEILPIIDKIDTVGFNLAILELSGEKIENILKHSVGWALENSKFGILQLSGLKMAYDPKRPKNNQIVDITVNGEKLDLNKIYKVAVNGYLASGGDGYYDIITAEKRIDTGLMDFDVVADYIKTHSPITPPPIEGRIVRIE